MSELAPLITDLALILAVAGVFSLLFKWLKQPVVLAYIVAGIVLSFVISQTNPEYESIETWAEIGIIFLLFGLGLEFNFKQLMRVGPTAFIATIFIVLSMIGVGYMTGLLFGWSQLTSLFLGAMLSMSSTMIIIKVFDDLSLTNKSFSEIVLGILILEDLVAVLLMVLLSTIAVSQNFEGTEMLFSLFKLVAFLVFWFILGTYLIPTFLRKAKRLLNDETLLIIALALCLGMVYLAVHSGFSAALGAFIMGSLLSATVDSERIEKMVVPIKNFFGAVFFVSVGMMIQVTSLSQYIVPILIISSIVIIGQVIFATAGVLLSGQDLKTSVSAGFSLTQIGEFSYIIGGLGLSLGVIENALYQTVVSASIITIFLTPYMMKLANPAYRFLEKKLPTDWKKALNKDVSDTQQVNHQTLWSKLLKKMIPLVILYYFICIIIVFFSFKYGVPVVQEYLPDWKGNLACAVVIILLISPFLRATIIEKNDSGEFTRLWKNKKSNRAPLVFTVIIRVVFCIGLIMNILFELFHPHLAISFLIALIILVIFLTSKHLQNLTVKAKKRFKDNLNEKEKYEKSKSY